MPKRFLSTVSSLLATVIRQMLPPQRKRNLGNIDYWLDKAKGLAYFIHFHDEIAELIVYKCMSAMHVHCNYRKRVRDSYAKMRAREPNKHSERGASKVLLTDAQALQELIYLFSGKCETYQECPDETNKDYDDIDDILRELLEQQPSLNQYEMRLRYLEHLVCRAMGHNSHYAMIGVTRLVYSYEREEAKNIEDLLFDGDGIKDSQQISKIKLYLMDKLEERFGDAIERVNPGRGAEQYFQGQQNIVADPETIEFVETCLDVFSLWETQCFQKSNGVSFDGSLYEYIKGIEKKNGKEKADMARTHAAFCAECYERLAVGGAGASPPRAKLALPEFDLRDVSAGGKLMKDWRWRLMPKPVDGEELSARIHRDAIRRKSFRGDELSIFIDGKLRSKIDLSQSRSASLQIDGDAKFLEASAVDDEGLLPMAALSLRRSELEDSLEYKIFGRKTYSMTLEGGQRIRFRVRYANASDGEGRFDLLIEYFAPKTIFGTFVAPAPSFAIPVAVILLLIAFGFAFYFSKREENRSIPPVVKQSPVNEPKPNIKPNPDENKQEVTQEAPPLQNKKPPSDLKPPQVDPKDEVIMSPDSSIGKKLAEINNVYIDPSGDASPEMLETLKKSLRNGGFIVVEEISQAEAVLKGEVEANENSFNVRWTLVNKRGEVLWRSEKRQSAQTVSEAIKQAIADLLQKRNFNHREHREHRNRKE